MKYYFDEHMPRIVAKQLANRHIEVVLAADVDMLNKDDDTEHLPFAQKIQAVLVIRDFAFARRALEIIEHAGLICWTGNQQDIGSMVKALMQFANDYSLEEVQGQVFWIK